VSEYETRVIEQLINISTGVWFIFFGKFTMWMLKTIHNLLKDGK
jgi:hypothetical protein